MDLIWGLKAAATDRWIGALDGVVVDAEARRVTHLIVRRGMLFTSRYEVSAERIARCDHEGVYLDIPMSDVFSSSSATPQMDDESTREVLNAKTLVEASGASLRLKGVRVNWESRSITHLVLRERGEGDFVVSADHMTGLGAGEVTLAIRQGELDNFPAYRLDDEIQADVWEALYDSSDISVVDLQKISVKSADGVVTMAGNMRGRSGVTEAEVVAALVPGVASIENHIVSDWDIDLKVARLIAKNAPELSDDISIHSQLGIVNLYGHAPSEADKAAVIDEVSSIKGVRGVNDNVEIRAPVVVAAEVMGEQGEGDEGEDLLDDE